MIVDIQKENEILHPLIYKDEDFSVYVEDNSIGWVLHCYVSNWSLKVYKKMLLCLVNIGEVSPRNEVYALSCNKKLTKFASLFGMESIDTLFNKENKEIGELLCLTL